MNNSDKVAFAENEIRPKDLMKLKEPALQHDKDFLRARCGSFIDVVCPACGSNHSMLYGKKEGFSYQECKDCQTIYMSPRADAKLMEEFYKQSENYAFWNKYIFPASDEVRREKIFKPRAIKTIEYCRRYAVTGTILEIGAAFGTYCESIRDQGYFDRIIAVEPTPGLAETCRQKGIETLEQTVETLKIDASSIDVLTSFEVIEHLFSPRAFIDSAVKFLKPGGLFICTCPNAKSVGGLVLRERASMFDHEHVNYFNPHSLGLLLEKCGFEVLEVSTPGELDVELLDTAYQSHSEWFENQDFFRHFLETTSDEGKKAFQSFLKSQKLSSHMWIVGRKR